MWIYYIIVQSHFHMYTLLLTGSQAGWLAIAFQKAQWCVCVWAIRVYMCLNCATILIQRIFSRKQSQHSILRYTKINSEFHVFILKAIVAKSRSVFVANLIHLCWKIHYSGFANRVPQFLISFFWLSSVQTLAFRWMNLKMLQF